MKFFLFVFLLSFAFGEKVSEVANVVGVRDNQLIGYGLVVGLNGTGDGSSSKFTLQSLSNMLQTVNVKISPNDIKSKNVAAVMVTAKLPAFSRQGDKTNVSISSIGDAKSLEGGTLILTPLKGVDGNIYALSQGAITIGGMNEKGGGTKNHTTVGVIFSGATIEREIPYDLYHQDYAQLSLKSSNFKTAISIQDELNGFFGDKVAIATDARTIKLQKPTTLSMVEFLAQALEVNVKYDKEEKIIIDERTATIVSGINITLDPVVITHGEITIKINPQNADAQIGKDSVDMKDGMDIGTNENMLNIQNGKITVANLTRALHKLGAKPKDIIAILQNIKRAGAIRATLEVI
ncbi:MAG: flagellar basal body P-ring protein FlgI [Sulfurospirillum sp.]|nr:flagellar basal body P-ring protein FlgI [Sulfurospirillum sp.]